VLVKLSLLGASAAAWLQVSSEEKVVEDVFGVEEFLLVKVLLSARVSLLSSLEGSRSANLIILTTFGRV
jgi:hypothetical protein